jgi:hypothetical protein
LLRTILFTFCCSKKDNSSWILSIQDLELSTLGLELFQI